MTITHKDLRIGDRITVTRSAASPTNPAPFTITGTLAAIWDSQHGAGGQITTLDGPVVLDLDCERMYRLYGVTQTITRQT